MNLGLFVDQSQKKTEEASMKRFWLKDSSTVSTGFKETSMKQARLVTDFKRYWRI